LKGIGVLTDKIIHAIDSLLSEYRGQSQAAETLRAFVDEQRIDRVSRTVNLRSGCSHATISTSAGPIDVSYVEYGRDRKIRISAPRSCAISIDKPTNYVIS
jgi:hypothetical protein